jgi:beta-N-acetylhexosaminidase
MRRRRLPAAGLARTAALAVLLLASACGSSSPGAVSPPTSASPEPAATAPPTSPVASPPARSPAPSPPTPSPAGPSPACLSPALEMAGWSTARKVAQLVAIPSLDFNVEQLGTALGAGAGGILFLGSGAAPENLATLVRTADSLAPAGVAPFTMADEEGGAVQRLESLVGTVASARQLAATETPAEVTRLVTSMAQRMRAAGIDMDLAPVLDVDGGAGPGTTNPDGTRSFSAVPSVVTGYGAAYVKGLEAGGVIPVAKHFPGLGGSSAQTLPLATLQTQGLPPFTAAIAGGIPAVMVANASVPGLTTAPASLSPQAINGLLRGTMGFSGLVLTDSLSAGAIVQAGYLLPAAAVAAVEAGADMVLFGSTLTAADEAALAPAAVMGSFQAVVNALEGAVASGQLPESRLDAAVLHVLQAKGPCL